MYLARAAGIEPTTKTFGRSFAALAFAPLEAIFGIEPNSQVYKTRASPFKLYGLVAELRVELSLTDYEPVVHRTLLRLVLRIISSHLSYQNDT